MAGSEDLFTTLTNDIPLPEKMDALARLPVPNADRDLGMAAWHVVNRVGREKRRDLVDRLKGLVRVRVAANDRGSGIAREAIFVLGLLGGEEAFLMSLVQAHATAPWFAGRAILGLALTLTPTDAEYRRIEETVRGSRDAGVNEAVGRYRRMLELETDYASKPDAAVKADFLVQLVFSSMQSERRPEIEPNSGTSLVELWCRRKMRLLARQHPVEAARGLAAFSPAQGTLLKEIVDYNRDSFAEEEFSPEALKHYRQLRGEGARSEGIGVTHQRRGVNGHNTPPAP